MSSLFVKGGNAERAAEYRRRAEDVLRHAADATDERTRTWFIEIANSYQTLAEHVEHRIEMRRGRERSAVAERYAKAAHNVRPH